jgi:chromate reductase, NAD(P)H dehydrogenase (quinone)
MILMLSGSLRAMSTNTSLLRTAATMADDAVLYDRIAQLPHFDPDDDVEPLHPEVQHLRDAIEAAEAIVICMPEYAGAMPGSFKNALDWTVGSMVMSGKPTAVVNVSAVGASKAQQSLLIVLGYVMVDLVETASVHIPVQRQHVDDDGLIHDPAVRQQIADMLSALRDHTAAA